MEALKLTDYPCSKQYLYRKLHETQNKAQQTKKVKIGVQAVDLTVDSAPNSETGQPMVVTVGNNSPMSSMGMSSCSTLSNSWWSEFCAKNSEGATSATDTNATNTDATKTGATNTDMTNICDQHRRDQHGRDQHGHDRHGRNQNEE